MLQFFIQFFPNHALIFGEAKKLGKRKMTDSKRLRLTLINCHNLIVSQSLINVVVLSVQNIVLDTFCVNTFNIGELARMFTKSLAL